MHQSCEKAWQTLDHSLEQLSKSFAAYSSEQLNAPGPNGGWSAMQCLHHLMLAEAVSEQYIRKKLQTAPSELPKKGFMEWFNSKKLSFFMLLPIKIKAPTYIDTEQLPARSELTPTLAAWQAQRQGLRQYLESLDESVFSLELFKHPIAGKLTLGSMLGFFYEHFQRHQAQAIKALQQAA